MKPFPLRMILAAGLAFALATGLTNQASAAIGCSANALRNAITVANGTPGADTIDLASGCTYTFTAPDAANPDSALPRITSNITISGNNATIERDGGAAAQFRLFYVTSGSKLTLKNVTVLGGSTDFGSGIYNDGGTLTLKKATVNDNTAIMGGGVYSTGGTLTVTDSEISANAADTAGGGIYNSGGTLTVTNSVFDGNDAPSGGGIYGSFTVTGSTFSNNTAVQGGGIFTFGTLDVTDCTFSGNSASEGGGLYSSNATVTVADSNISDNTAGGGGGIFHRNNGIFVNVAVLTVTGSTISGNDATNVNISGGGITNYGGSKTVIIDSQITGNTAVGFGGGLANYQFDGLGNFSSMVVKNSTVSGNTATTDGGGIYSAEGPLVVIDSNVAGNSASDDGGGIFVGGTGTLGLTNSIISGNKSAGDGGGIAVESATVTVDTSTIAGNDAGTTGGALDSDSSTVTIRNSVVWGNDTQVAITSTVLSITHTTIQGGAAGTGNSTTDPLFVSLIPAASAPTSTGDYHLTFASPAIEHGNAGQLPADSQDLDGDGNTAEPLPYDHDGNPRAVNAIPDMGAFEVGQLLANRDFEINEDGNKNVPDGWTLKSPSGDKLLCDAAKADTGSCAFQFRGSAGEAAVLEQKGAIAGIPFAEGDSLTVSAFVQASSPSAQAKLTVKVKYVNGTSGKEKVSVGQSASYTQFSSNSVVLTNATVKYVKAVITHTSAGGKLYVDGVSLVWFPSPLRRAALPPPDVPGGLRGLN